MTPDELRAAYDDQLRTDAEMARATEVVREGPLLWAVFDHGGFVSYRDLGGLEGEALDELIDRTVRHFRDDTDVESFEWKSRGHDLPADLGERLEAHGLVAEPVETVMIGEASLLADLRRTEFPEMVWERQQNGRTNTLNWYRSVHERLRQTGFTAPIMRELGETMEELERVPA